MQGVGKYEACMTGALAYVCSWRVPNKPVLYILRLAGQQPSGTSGTRQVADGSEIYMQN